MLQLAKLFLLAGDFNINLLHFETNNKVQSLLNLIFEFSMIPTIKKPARVTKHTATAVDNIITSWILKSDFKSTIVKTDLSYHSQLHLLMSLNETLLLQMISRNMYTSKILMKTHAIVLNRHYLKHLGIALKI